MSENGKRARGEGRLFLRGNVWWIQYYSRGAQIRESAGTDDEKKAARLLRKRTGAVANGIAIDRRGLRYEDLRDSYLADYEDRKSLRHDRDGNGYLECVRRLDAYFAGFRAVEIDADTVRAFHKDQREKGLANGTINRSVAALRRMFRLAQQDGKLRNLPFFPMLKEAKPRKGVLPAEKYPELLAALPEHLRSVVAIAFRTGMRLGEITGLSWSNILWMDRIIRLEDTKNNDAREIPFSGELETVLRDQFAKRREGCDRVCFRIDGSGRPRSVGNFRKSWRRACISVGLGKMEPKLDHAGQPILERPRYAGSKPKPKMVYTGLIVHDLRRSFITDAENSGAPRHEVMKISGHRTEAVYKRYAIEQREQRRKALAQVDAYRAKQFGDNSGTIEPHEAEDQSVIN